MDAGISTARQTRTHHRHELRTLTYVTLDQANGGIVRNLTADGIGVQAVAALRPRQQLRVRFELRYPRLRVEAHGEVLWSTSSGQCGIRFLDLPPRMGHQINEWIFGNLLEGISLHRDRPMFGAPAARAKERHGQNGPLITAEEEDGLLMSPAPLRVIELASRPDPGDPVKSLDTCIPSPQRRDIEIVPDQLGWLSQPLSSRGLAWTINTLAVIAGLLLSAFVFLSVTGHAPRWPIAMTVGAACLVAAMYWGFFQLFGGSSLGTRLAQLAARDEADQEESESRFR